MDEAIPEGLDAIRNTFGNTFVIAVRLGSGSEDEHFEVEEEPPKGVRVCLALKVGLLWVVCGQCGKYQPDDVPIKFPEPDFVDILEEAPPGRIKIWWLVRVYGGDEVEALKPLMGLWVIWAFGINDFSQMLTCWVEDG